MAAAITIVPESGSVIAVVTACRISVADVPSNDPATFDEDDIPTMAPKTYRIVARKTGIDSLVSHLFTPSSEPGIAPEGAHVWDNVIFPDDGTWTVELIDQADDTVDATLSVVVTA